MNTPEAYKRAVQEEIEVLRGDLIEISRTIHRHPELGLEEHRARDLLVSKIRKLDFEVSLQVAGLDTGFAARYRSGRPGPTIAFLAEYDALPELGHACGHNVIAASSFGAAAALRRIVSQTGGTILLIGTPDEEAISDRSKGGKVVMARAGVFEGVDAALMMHPTGGPHAAWRYTFPLKDFTARFVGKPAHYTRPEEGINALESLLLFLNTANALKRSWRPDVLFAYTVTDGGGPSAITVPKTAEAHLTLKAFHSAYLERLFESVEACLQGVADLTGAKGTIRVLDEYRNTIPNLHLTLSLHRNLLSLGGETEDPVQSRRNLERMRYPGISTDFGDVSWVVPAIHGYCSLGPSSLIAHTPEFAAAAGGESGDRAVLLSAKALALTGLDLLADPSFAAAVRDEFTGYAEGDFQRVPGLPPDFDPFPEEMQKAFAAEQGQVIPD
ncbi:MAG: amidohydrolase [Deltaproteobacteria bacterium]|nr:amidohydrolase [Deltaproteobacteria bacterium]